MKAVIFDLDGVVVNTAKYHYLAWKKLAAELGFEFEEVHNERLKGVSRMESLNIVLEAVLQVIRERTSLRSCRGSGNSWTGCMRKAIRPLLGPPAKAAG